LIACRLAQKKEEIEKHIKEREELFTTELSKKEEDIKSYQDKVNEKLEILEKEANAVEEVKGQWEKEDAAEKEAVAKLEMYTKKGDQFHQVVARTNEVLTNLKQKMEKVDPARAVSLMFA
jgi:chromosome segregation ATPase